MNKILAYRDGQEREFTERVWEAMGIGHCGWVQAPEIPREVVESLEVAPAIPKEVAESFVIKSQIPRTDIGVYAPPGAEKVEGILEFTRKTRKKND